MNFVSWNAIIYIVFLSIYMAIDMKTHFGTEKNTLVNALYFTTTTHTTVGFGDITAKTPLAKMLVSAHMLCVWTLVAITISWEKV